MERNDYMFGNLEYFRPDIVREAIDIRKYNNWELIIEMKNGDTLIYDDATRQVRVLPDNKDDMSEEEWSIEFRIRLSNMMTRRCMTQERLSELTGITRPMLSRYLTGRSIPSFRTIDKIARALDCSVDEFRYY